MLQRITRWFRRGKADRTVEQPYVLPSDDPEVSPIIVEEPDEVHLAEVASLNSALLARITPDASGMSVRTRAVVEIKSGLEDLGSHVRSLGQRLQAQTMSNARLIEALSNLPQMLREVIPNGEEQNRALCAMKLALDEQTEANRHFVEALKPLPEFVRAAGNLPETARKQMWAMEQLTEQMEKGNLAAQAQSEQVKVMVETLAQQETAKGAQVQGMVEQLTRFQRAQLRQQVNALKAGQEAMASQRRHQAELERTQQSKLNMIQREQGQNFLRLEEHFKSNARRQMAITGIAAALAIGALVFVALLATGLFKDDQPSPIPEAERNIPAGTVVSR
jgi:hypothetical protein